MAKSKQTYLLAPGESDWQIWMVSSSGEVSLHSSHAVKQVSEMEKMPLGEIIFHFPVKAFTSLPLYVPTKDASLFDEFGAIHAERLGLKPDPLAGQLTDCFNVQLDEASSIILYVVLRTPPSEELPTRSPIAFDLSPRAFEVEGSSLVLWKELGNWVFAFYQQGAWFYSQATNFFGPSPDAALLREIRMAMAQLSIQGVYQEPTKAVVWSSDPETELSFLAEALSIPVELGEKPNPIPPLVPSKLFPADVRAARLAARKQRNLFIALGAIAAAYLVTISYFTFQLWETHRITQKILAKVQAVAPQGEAYALHLAKWDELEYAVDLNFNTVDLLSRVASCIPPGSQIRLTTADVSPTEIRLIGEAPTPAVINQFSLNLTKQNDLAQFTWQTPAPRQNDRAWQFVYTGEIPSNKP